MVLPHDEEPICAQDEGKIPFGCWKKPKSVDQCSEKKKKKKEDLPPRIKYATNSWVFEKPTTPKASPVAWDAKRIVIWKRMMVKREPNVKCLVAYP